MIKIEGTLRLTSPLHVPSFRKGLRITDNEWITQDEKDTKPFTGTMKMNFADGSRDIHSTAFYPSNGFRGALRRFAAKRVIAALGQVNRQTYHGLMCGASSGQPGKDIAELSVIKRARDNVYMGLFGGSPNMYRSRYTASDAIPVTAAAIEGGLIPESFRDKAAGRIIRRGHSSNDYAKPHDITWYLHFNRVDDILTFRDEGADARIEDYKEATAKWIEEVQANKKKVNASKDGPEKASKIGITAMSAIEVVGAGTELYVRFTLEDDLENHHIGLFLLSLLDLVNENRIGAWRRNGFGHFTPSLTVSMDDGEPEQLLQQRGSRYELLPAMATFVEDAERALSELKRDEVEAFFEEKKKAA